MNHFVAIFLGKRFAVKNIVVLLSVILTLISYENILAQTLPSPSSCTSKDLELKSVKLAYTGLCFPYGQPTNVILEINNKTGSLRTAFACWAKLVRTTKEGTELAPVSIFMCGGPIQPSSTTSITTNTQITVGEGESIILKDLFLAWTTSNANQNCDFLKNNSATINPKCGILPSIRVQAGVAGSLAQSTAVCGDGGSVTNLTITPYGGTAPYKVSIDDGSEIDVAATASYTFSGISSSVVHKMTIKDKNGCTNSVNSTISSATVVTANAGDDFVKNCQTNVAGKTIGETPASGFSYSWSPSEGLSNAAIANPIANPASTSTYTVTKTNTSTGCKGSDQVVVTVDNDPVTAFAGNDFTKTCVDNLSGKEIGESSAVGFTYSWSPSDGLSDASIANPIANPAATKSYTFTKTKTSSGCKGTDEVVVTVNDTKPSFGVTLVQPTVSLCAASTLGRVTFCATGGSGFEYSIDNGNTYFANAVFINLGSGSVSGYKVRNSFGCVSDATCESVTTCPSELKATALPIPLEGTVEVAGIPQKNIIDELKIKVYPNPFNGRVNFNIYSPVEGKAVLELFDSFGRKMGLVFEGMMRAGETRIIPYVAPIQFKGTLIYRYSLGEKTTNGRMISAYQKE